MANSNEGTIPALSDEQVRWRLKASVEYTLKCVRDHAIFATLLYHGCGGKSVQVCR